MLTCENYTVTVVTCTINICYFDFVPRQDLSFATYFCSADKIHFIMLVIITLEIDERMCACSNDTDRGEANSSLRATTPSSDGRCQGLLVITDGHTLGIEARPRARRRCRSTVYLQSWNHWQSDHTLHHFHP